MRLEPAGVGHDPQLRPGQVPRLPTHRRPRPVKSHSVCRDAGDRDHLRFAPGDQTAQPLRPGLELVAAELIGTSGGSRNDIGDADSLCDNRFRILWPHALDG